MKWLECLIEWNDDDDLARAEEKREKREREEREISLLLCSCLLFEA